MVPNNKEISTKITLKEKLYVVGKTIKNRGL